ncbi:hypothetical protein OKW28_005940 [Paraburkholderia sp. 40]
MQKPDNQDAQQGDGPPPQPGDDQQPTEYEHPCRGVVPPGGLTDDDE